VTCVSLPDPPAGSTIRLCDRAAIVNLRIVLELCASGQLRCSAKTRRSAATSVSALAVLLTDADFYPDEAIAAYAWPLLVQAADLAEVVSGRLRLTDRGPPAPDRPRPGRARRPRRNHHSARVASLDQPRGDR
jgi:hypothetical protein